MSGGDNEDRLIAASARRTVRCQTPVAQTLQLLEADVAADPAAGVGDPLLQVGAEGLDDRHRAGA